MHWEGNIVWVCNSRRLFNEFLPERSNMSTLFLFGLSFLTNVWSMISGLLADVFTHVRCKPAVFTFNALLSFHLARLYRACLSSTLLRNFSGENEPRWVHPIFIRAFSQLQRLYFQIIRIKISIRFLVFLSKGVMISFRPKCAIYCSYFSLFSFGGGIWLIFSRTES